MLLLTSASDLIQVVTASAVTGMDVHASWVDVSGSTVTPGRTNTAQITGAATTTVVAAPAGSTQRNVKFLSIRNVHATSSNVITVQHFDGTTTTTLIKFTLLAGYSMAWNDATGWQLYDTSGAPVVTPLAGRWLRRTTILNGTTTFTTSAATNSIIARLLAGGGQGGGSPATTGVEGAGGGSGSYAEWSVNVSPSTGYTCAVGAGGSTSGTNATGQTGGNTTLAVGATTVTCNGGVGGPVGTSIAVPVLGGAGGAISTNGTLNVPGNSGAPPMCTGTAINNASGAGANSPLGNGGAAKVNASNTTGSAAGGFGAGGGGSVSTGTLQAGGAGSPGIIIVDEYS